MHTTRPFRDLTALVGKGWDRRIFAAALVMMAGLISAQSCFASQLLAVGASAADVALAGSTVAEPKTPAGAMFSNPAGLVLFERITADTSAGISAATTEIDASAPPAYEEDNSFLILSPSIGLAVPRAGGWHYGFAAYGSVGTKFDFDADPTAGVNHDFLSEAAIFTFAPGVAYRFSDRLSVGAAFTPLLGTLKMDFTAGGVPFDFRATGPGIQGMFGLRWVPDDGLSVGVSARTPGRVWMDGSSPLGGVRQDVDLELEMPAQIFAGVTKHLGEKTAVSAAFRWSDASSLGNSLIEFELTPDASVPFIPAANDEYLVGVGVEYAWSDFLAFRLGGGHANAITGGRGVSPLVFDTDDYRVAAGFGLKFDHWSLDFMAGHAFEESRSIAADEAAVFPGRYTIKGEIMMIGATWRR